MEKGTVLWHPYFRYVQILVYDKVWPLIMSLERDYLTDPTLNETE